MPGKLQAYDVIIDWFDGLSDQVAGVEIASIFPAALNEELLVGNLVTAALATERSYRG